MNNSIAIAAIEERKELIIDIDENLEPQAECCIYRVPRDLRQINEEAYTPKVISIGPLHHGKDELADMEKQKIRYKREFGKRIRPEKWQQLINFIEENEKRIRNSYEGNSKLEKLEFITMILYDAVFIIELFLRKYRNESDFLLDRPGILATIWQDLLLLENQIPYFVVDGLYNLAFPNLDPGRGYPSFILLSSLFLSQGKSDDEISVEVAIEVKHLTDLGRYFVTIKYPEPQSKEWIRDLPCAVKLQESGIKFNGFEGCILDIRFAKKKLRIPFLKFDELQIPRVDVSDTTESLMRNLMALEQCHYPDKTLVCNYIDLMDMLIDTEEDVNLLVEAGIISNNMGESARIAKMFNTLCQQISITSSNYYNDIIKDLKAHYDNPWNHAKANLKRVYFSNLWRGTGTIAAIMLLLLTLIQTICSVLQVV